MAKQTRNPKHVNRTHRAKKAPACQFCGRRTKRGEVCQHRSPSGVACSVLAERAK